MTNSEFLNNLIGSVHKKIRNIKPIKIFIPLILSAWNAFSLSMGNAGSSEEKGVSFGHSTLFALVKALVPLNFLGKAMDSRILKPPLQT